MNSETPKWYIATTVVGTEDVVYKNIEDKIRAYGLTDLVKEIKLLKSKEVTIEIFDNKNNPPPKSMRNTKSITWESLPGNKYKKTRVREVNTFPGYIYIQMIMTQEAWYAIRNTYGITGFVGSSGKGAQPIPMSDYEVAELFDQNRDKDIIIDKSNEYTTNHLETRIESVSTKSKESKVEFLSVPEIVGVNNKPFVVDQASDDLSEMKDIYLSDHERITTNNPTDNFNENHGFKIGQFVNILSDVVIERKGYIKSIDEQSRELVVVVDTLGSEREIILGFDDVSLEDK